MDMRSVSFAVVFALGCPLSGCEPPHVALQPGAADIAINDNRSIESCKALGLVTATTPYGVGMSPPHYNLDRTLRNNAVDRGANYIEAMPMQCERGMPCTRSGNAYRCPDSSPSTDTKTI
jgi:hypothetical protein